jgi:site-specific recombinase XerD
MFKRGDIWWTCIRHNGRKIQKSLKTTNKKLAQSIEAKIRTEIVEGIYFEKLVGRNKTFKDMMDRFMKEYAPKLARNTQISYVTSLKHLNLFFGGCKLLSISPKMISRYKVLRREEGAAPGSVNIELTMLSKAFSLAVKEWEWLNENPVAKVPNEKENSERDRWLTEEEEGKILANSPVRIREIVVFLLNTGLRIEECLSLEWSRVNLLRKTILIQKTKSGRPKTLPLNATALEVLNQRSTVKSIKNDYVFLSSNGRKIFQSPLRTSFYRVLNKVGIENFCIHDLRHTFATRLAQSGVDLYKISKLLGHKDIKMTQRYAHHCPDSLRDGVDTLETDYNLTTIGEK